MSVGPQTQIPANSETSPLGPDTAQSVDGLDDDVAVRRARRAFTVAWMLALLALALALVLNWFAAPGAGEPFPGLLSDEPVPEPAEFTPSESSVALLPSRILSYETMTLQAIPGQENRSAEAIYVTMNMDIEIQRPINTYVRVEQYPTPGEAERRKQELLDPYPVDHAQILAGTSTIADVGWAPDDSAYTVAWTRDTSVFMVKTSYKDIPPVQDTRKFLLNVSAPVIDAVADHRPESE